MPLVPLASSGRRGVLSQTSHALHQHARHVACRSLRGRRPAARSSALGAAATMLLDELLAARSAGWALPAKMICTGRSVSSSRRAQALEVAEERACRACRWRSGGRSRWSARRDRAGPPAARSSSGRAAVARALRAHALAHEADEALASVSGAPPTARRRGCRRTRSRASGSSRGGRSQSGSEVAGVERAHLRAEPARGVHAVGDGADRASRGASGQRCRHMAEETVPCSLLTPLTLRREADGEHGHVEACPPSAPRREGRARASAPTSLRSRAPR